MSCDVCVEKQREINRILAAYRKDKKFLRRVAMGEAVIIIMYLSFGTSGIKMIFDVITGIFGG